MVRWWDGQGWTERTSTAPGAAPVATPAAAPVPAPAVQTAATYPGVTAAPTYPGATSAGFPGVATAGYPGAATAGYPGAATAGYPGVTSAGFPGTATAGYPGVTSAGFPGAAATGPGATAFGSFQGVPAYGTAAAGPTTFAAPPDARAGLGLILGGVVVLVGATVILRLAASNGGVYSLGAFVFAALLVVRGISARNAARAQGGGGPLLPVVAGVGVVALVCGFVAFDSLRTVTGMDLEALGPGACFAEKGEWLEHVPCSDAHDYIGTIPAATPQQCADSGSGLFAEIDDSYLCLRADS